MQVMMELELGLLDDAERTAATLARGIAQWTTNKQQAQAAHAGWLTAEIEKRRGRPKRAEALAKRGLATLLELKVPADRIALVRTTLADSLFAQGRIAEARAQLDAAFALKAAANDREDDIAERELLLAKIEVAEGNRAAAALRAKRALAVLDRYPRHIIARREAEQLIRDAK
jgi:ATP/maltotriose-dependent transcriptional regulator MalT